MGQAHRLPRGARHRGGAAGAAARELVVLDLDGTLVQLDVDWPAVRATLRERLERAGLLVGDDRVLPLLAQARAQAPPLARDLEGWLGRVEAAAGRRCRVNRSVLEWLGARAETPYAICTSNGRACVEPALAAAGLAARPPAGVVAREDVRRWKPDPEGVHALLATVGARPEHTLFVGDSSADAEAGRAAGIRVVAAAEIGFDWREAA